MNKAAIIPVASSRKIANTETSSGRRVFVLLIISVVLILQAVFAGLAHGQQGVDTIVKVDGTRVSGKLIAMSADKVTMEVRRAETEVPVSEIDHMRFYDEARRTNSAREYIQNSQYEQAAKELSSMTEEWAEARPTTALDGQFLLATAKAKLALSGVEGHSLADAVNLVRSVRDRGSEHYSFYPACLLYARLGTAANRLDLAKQEYQTLQKVSDTRIVLDANLELGQILLIEKDYSAAANAFDLASAVDATDPESLRKKTVASLLKEVAVAGSGQTDAAIQRIQEMIDSQDAEDSLINGFAYNALGEIYLMTNQPKQAEVAFLHTDLLFAANAEAHAQALYQLVQLWKQMGKSDRVSEARDKLMNRYGGTYWTARLNAR